MSRGRKPVCAVCGMGGYWVAYSPKHGEDRCINHLHTEERSMVLDETIPDVTERARYYDDEAHHRG